MGQQRHISLDGHLNAADTVPPDVTEMGLKCTTDFNAPQSDIRPSPIWKRESRLHIHYSRNNADIYTWTTGVMSSRA